MKYAALFAIFVLFSLGVVLAPLALLVMPWRASKIFQAMNRLCGAAYFGFDGKQTISKTCGQTLRLNPKLEPCCTLCAALEVLENDHCAKEAAL